MVKVRKADRCTGHCCARFVLPLSPEELWGSYDAWTRGKAEVLARPGTGSVPVYTDIFLIAPMVAYLGKTTDLPEQVNPTDAELLGEKTEAHLYACKHFDPKTRDCTIYEHRPWMCRYYPGRSDCNYAACTWRSRKAKRETKRERAERKRRLEGGLEGAGALKRKL